MIASILTFTKPNIDEETERKKRGRRKITSIA